MLRVPRAVEARRDPARSESSSRRGRRAVEARRYPARSESSRPAATRPATSRRGHTSGLPVGGVRSGESGLDGKQRVGAVTYVASEIVLRNGEPP